MPKIGRTDTKNIHPRPEKQYSYKKVQSLSHVQKNILARLIQIKQQHKTLTLRLYEVFEVTRIRHMRERRAGQRFYWKKYPHCPSKKLNDLKSIN